MLTVTLAGDRELIERLESMPTTVREALDRKVSELALRLEAKVKGKLSGEVLQVRTGALRRSIAGDVTHTAASVTGRVYSSGDVKYAGIHEFGGTTKAHVIEALNGKALAFKAGGKPVFAKRVNHPGSKVPERSYLRSSLTEMRDEIVEGLRQTVADSIRK